MLESRIINHAATIVDKFDELEQRLDNHINQEAAQEAAHEAASREMRAIINRHSEERVAEMEAAYARQQREARAQEVMEAAALHEKQYIAFWVRSLVSLTVAALFMLGVACETMVPDLGIVGALGSCGYCGVNLVAYATRNNRKGE